MTNGQREVRLTPFVANGVNIRVADARSLDVDDDVIGARLATLDGHNLKRFVWACLL